MIIRTAQESDLPRLIELGEEFALKSQSIHTFSVSREKIIKFAFECMDNPSFILLVLEDEEILQGLICGLVVSPFFSDDIIFQELVWYVRDRGRQGMMLLVELQREAKRRGVTKMVIGHKPGFIDMSKIYAQMGYKLFEEQYIKDLN